jgi:hypothetical protein
MNSGDSQGDADSSKNVGGNELKIRRFDVLLIVALVLGLCSLPATAGTLFSDLGPAGSVYNCCTAWTVDGAGTSSGLSFSAANLFTLGGSGSEAVTRIDLGVSYGVYLDTFQASIWTDNAGLPGVQVAGADWSPLSSTTLYGNCCGLVSITGITGVTLIGGQQYFMILSPVKISDASDVGWDINNQGVNGLDLYSYNGGLTWNSNGTGNAIGAFDIQGSATPEPGSLLL